jgi:hypothetical protein
VADVNRRRVGAHALQAAIRRLCGEEDATAVSPLAAVGLPEPPARREAPKPLPPPRTASLLRSVFPPFRTH